MFVIIGCSKVQGRSCLNTGDRMTLLEPFQVLDTDDAVVEACTTFMLQELVARGYRVEGNPEFKTLSVVVPSDMYEVYLSKVGKGDLLPFDFKFAYNKDKTAVQLSILSAKTVFRVDNTVDGDNSQITISQNKHPIYTFEYREDEVWEEGYTPLASATLQLKVEGAYRIRNQFRIPIVVAAYEGYNERQEWVQDLLHFEAVFGANTGHLEGIQLGQTYKFDGYLELCDFFTASDYRHKFRVVT